MLPRTLPEVGERVGLRTLFRQLLQDGVLAVPDAPHKQSLELPLTFINQPVPTTVRIYKSLGLWAIELIALRDISFN